MSIIAPGLMIITVFLLTSTLMFGTFLTVSAMQGDSLKDLATANIAQAGDQLNITSAVVDSPDTGDLTVTVNNTGSRSTPDFSQMDVILEYTDTSNNTVVIYINHSASAPGNNEWTIPGSGITPDSFNPNMWDSDEVITIDILVSPAVKSNTAALVTVVTPWGISDTSQVTNP